MTVSDLDTSFNNSSHLPTLSDQAVNVSSADDFVSDPCFRLLSYHCYCLRPSPHQAVNVSSIDKLTNCRSRFMSSSTSSQTLVGANISRIHNSRPRYSHNSCHRLDITDSLKTMNQKLLRLKD